MDTTFLDKTVHVVPSGAKIEMSVFSKLTLPVRRSNSRYRFHGKSYEKMYVVSAAL
jgi:hypothetical protein